MMQSRATGNDEQRASATNRNNVASGPSSNTTIVVSAPSYNPNGLSQSVSPSPVPPPQSNQPSYPSSAPATQSHAATASLYQCAHCQRRYSRPEHLARHIQTHTLGKRFACQICGKAFARQDLLKRHVTNHENDNDPNKKRRRTDTSPGAGRVSHACRPCATARVKCEEVKPCTRCRNRNLNCEYSSTEAGSAAAMHLLHLSGNPHATTSTPGSLTTSPSQSAYDSSPSTAYQQHPHNAMLPPRDENCQLGLGLGHHVKSETGHLPTRGNAMDQVGNGAMPVNFEIGNPPVDMTLPFSDFLQNVIYEPGMEVSRMAEAQGLAVLDFCDNSNLELNEVDFGLLDHWNMDGMGTAGSNQSFTPRTDDSVDLVQMRQNLVKVWTESPWQWAPNKLDSGYVEHPNFSVPADDTSSAAFQESRKKHARIVRDRLDQSGRDQILAIVLSTCKSDSIMSRVASSFPSLEVMDSLIHIFLASHFCQTSQWIHHGSFSMSSQWPEWLAVAASSGATLTPVQTLRKFGFALQEAVRVTIPARFEDANTSIKNLGFLQTLILGQDIGLWSGNRRKMEIAECHLLIPITMMRYRGKFQRASYPIIEVSMSDEGEVLENKWKVWCERESWKRLLFHCFVRDAQTSMTALTNPSMSYSELTLPLPEAKELWFAKTAAEWKMHCLERTAGQSKLPPSICDLFRDINLLATNRQQLDLQFTISIYLHGYWALIHEYLQLCSVLRTRTWLNNSGGKSEEVLRSRHAELCKDLQGFLLVTSNWHEMLSTQESLVLHLLMMNLHLSLNDLQLFSGKEGEDQARQVFGDLREWSQSAEARQSLWHAGQILRQAKMFPQGHLKDFYAVAVHHAALACWTYGVVSKAGGKQAAQYEQEKVFLDGTESNLVHRFIGFNQGRPVITGPMSRAGGTEASLDDPKACMEVAQEILRANFRDSGDLHPPIVENLCLLIKQLGHAAWAVGMG
ncbi:early growth response protein 1 [Colletotrichum spaethianum]|uniref:Early growth response protein 1 n=1 Tax=Colletotrichum spaethianum TaxID=700344 RepID=A0AA37NXH7_9PEZI|nr:early growth response protein 1 [Colletotrichum spaethianum]GKT42350.1 early growth response protein 1 [Colletotrichum spaethianum]